MSDNPKQAKDSLHELVKHVFSHSLENLEGISYQELATRIGRLNKHGDGHGHGMGKVLGIMGHLLQDLEGEWGEPIPHIQSLVVNKVGSLKGLPDEGIKEFWPDYPMFSREEKQNKVRAEYVRIVEFGSRWNRVLSDLDLPAVRNSTDNEPTSTRRYGRGGESPEHLALKNYVCANPALVGADPADAFSVEYPFPSLDTVDVLFKGHNRWLAVEVKSRISDQLEEDYERGIYQCVKYRALLMAMQKDMRYRVPENIHVVLLLESSLPQKYRNTANALGIEVIENIHVPKGNS